MSKGYIALGVFVVSIVISVIPEVLGVPPHQQDGMDTLAGLGVVVSIVLGIIAFTQRKK